MLESIVFLHLYCQTKRITIFKTINTNPVRPTVYKQRQNNMKNLAIEEIKKDMISKLSDYAGCSYYGCDLAYTLFERENANGSVFCNTYTTKEYIKANFDLFGEFLESYKIEFGDYLNPFVEPEKCHVIFLLQAVSSILSKCELVNDNWNNQLELTAQNIAALTDQINEFEGDIF